MAASCKVRVRKAKGRRGEQWVNNTMSFEPR